MSYWSNYFLAVLLSYLGFQLPEPAPPGWRAFPDPRFTIHLPAGWEEIPAEDVAALFGEKAHADDRYYQQADQPRWAMPLIRASLWTSATPPIETLPPLRKREAELRAELGLGQVDGRTYRLSPIIFDSRRGRFWCKFELFEAEVLELTTFKMVILTTEGFAEIDAFSETPEDPAFEALFRTTANTFELEEDLRFAKYQSVFSDFGRQLGILWYLLKKPDAAPEEMEKQLSALMLPAILAAVCLLSALLFSGASLFGGRFKAKFLQQVEGSTLGRSGRKPVEEILPAARLRYVPLPWSLALLIIHSFVLAIWLLPEFLQRPDEVGPAIRSFSYVTGYGLLALAIGIHYLPNSRRRVKYELLAAALAVMSVPACFDDPWNHASIVGQPTALISAEYLGNMLSAAFYFLLAGWLSCRILKKNPGRLSGNKVADFYWLTHSMRAAPAGMIAFAPLFPGGGFFGGALAYLTARFLFGEKALENPILYLRSFHDQNLSEVLAKIVMPEASRLGPVKSVAHDLQPASEIYRRATAIDSARLFVLSSKDWQESIAALLPHCRAVILDVSIPSQSVLWELEQARLQLSKERILVLVRQDVDFDVSGEADEVGKKGETVLRYGLDPKSRKRARKDLRQWLERLRKFEHSLPEAKAAPAS